MLLANHHRVIATEAEPLRISCNPTGYPTPAVEWRREDATPMIQVSNTSNIFIDNYYVECYEFVMGCVLQMELYLEKSTIMINQHLLYLLNEMMK